MLASLKYDSFLAMRSSLARVLQGVLVQLEQCLLADGLEIVVACFVRVLSAAHGHHLRGLLACTSNVGQLFRSCCLLLFIAILADSLWWARSPRSRSASSKPLLGTAAARENLQLRPAKCKVRVLGARMTTCPVNARPTHGIHGITTAFLAEEQG